MREYLTFTKRERIGILSLVVILVVLIIIPGLYRRHDRMQILSANDNLLSPDSMLQGQNGVPRYNNKWADDSAGGHHADNWRRNDSRPIQRDHGTRKNNRNYYYRDGNVRNNNYKEKKYIERPSAPQYARYNPPIIDINAADTAAFIALPGIGPVLARRIVTFREKLGGFYGLSQIGEVYGLTDSVYTLILPRLRCDSGDVRKLLINSAHRDTLQQHPYIRWKGADALIAYRNQHGAFRSLDELTLIHRLDSISIEKMKPYLSLQ